MIPHVSGDVNIHWEEENVSKSIVSNWCKDFSFAQIIKEPIRIRIQSGSEVKSIIDLCFSRNSDKNVTPSVVELEFSDHKGLVINIGRENKAVEYRKFKRWVFTPELFEEAKVNPLMLGNETNLECLASNLTEWLSYYQRKADSVVTTKIKPHQKPWYSCSLLDMKNQYLKAVSIEQRKSLRNKYVNTIKCAKAQYFSDKAKKLSKTTELLKF